MEQRRAVVKKLSEKYRKASKYEKGAILDQVVELTGYHRDYAAWVLRAYGKRVQGVLSGQRVVVIADKRKRKKRKRKPVYGDAVQQALESIWVILDQPCGKRLAPYLKTFVPVLERHGELHLEEATRAKLWTLSAATIDRRLRGIKQKYGFRKKKRVWTKPGSTLLRQIPIRRFDEWDHTVPGFEEVDLVAHDGGEASGEYAQTLDVTDVCSGWAEFQAVRNKAQRWVFEAMEAIRERLPFPLLGLDSDNGAEFINHHLFRYCSQEKITFTRSRPYRKNDSCYVEQKNYSVVRKYAGYARFDTQEQLRLLNELYALLRLYINFFQPVMKRIREKAEPGPTDKKKSRRPKRYDVAKTPYQRLLESPALSKAQKAKLTRQYRTLNPVALKQAIERKQDRLWQTIQRRRISTRASSG